MNLGLENSDNSFDNTLSNSPVKQYVVGPKQIELNIGLENADNSFDSRLTLLNTPVKQNIVGPSQVEVNLGLENAGNRFYIARPKTISPVRQMEVAEEDENQSNSDFDDNLENENTLNRPGNEVGLQQFTKKGTIRKRRKLDESLEVRKEQKKLVLKTNTLFYHLATTLVC